MGQEVSHAHFSANEYQQFAIRLQQETHHFQQQLNNGNFSSHPPMGGFEVEAWLTDPSLRPAPLNKAFFQCFNNPLATPELAKFNIELNTTPLALTGNVFEYFEQELNTVFKSADQAATTLNSNVLLTGILPTLKQTDCCLANMSEMKRYKALNELILTARGNKPLQLDIKGKDHLQLTHHSVMLECATTSFQIHLQTPWQLAHHYYNASIIASAPLLAIAGNSPFLFSKQLWQETRIPLFEQAVGTGGGLARVSFGTDYANNSISECFIENLRDYPVLLPMLFDENIDTFSHLRLHNGVIWRWNRPLVGFDADQTPHIRIEQRVLPAGPTIVDMMANAVFFYGLTHSLMQKISAEKKQMPFQQAKQNFYQAAQHGLATSLHWEGKHYAGKALQALIVDQLLPRAEQGLRQLNIAESSISYYLAIIAERTTNGQTGAIWQINHLQHCKGDWQQLTHDYLQRQHQGNPVHTWKL